MKLKISIVLSILVNFYIYSQNINTHISTNKIKYGEPIILKIEVKASGRDKVIFPFIKDTLTYHLELIEDKKDTLINDANHYIYTDSITFSAYEIGTFTVPSLPVLVNSREYSTPEYNITVDSMEIDTIKQPLYDIYPIISEPKTFKDYFEQYWVYMVMGVTILLVAVILAVLYYLERKKKKSGNFKDANPDKIAIKKLLKLEKSGYLTKGLSKKYYSEMILILKEYMEARWKFPATKLLSDDLLVYLKENKYVDEEEARDLSTIFQSADLAKFAKSRPTVAETKVHTEMAKKFVNETKTEFLNYRQPDEY
ncbi:BatD family protein [Apibacter sp. HY039]|uniref:BatD family protein n=1 Tax=Apibacter sp. HY039 TaxID=2501476 RepID=UPI000FEBCE6D|nr:BatD family protein [Apibacter sp. HY039]